MKRLELDPVISQTNERLRQLGVRAGLFDLDDALIYTSELYRFFMDEYVSAVAAGGLVDRDLFAERLKTLNDEGYKTNKVNPNRWEVVVAGLAMEFPEAADLIIQSAPILYKIYSTVPRIRAGATSILSGLRDGGFKVGVVTHSGEEWALWKLKMTGLFEHLDAVVVADQDGEKTSEHWRRCAGILGVDGRECLVFGDNLKGDIMNGTAIGAKGIWMPSPWSLYREGVVPEGVVQIEELEEFWDGVSRLT